MIVLDTNIVSALMRPTIDPRIFAWLSGLGATPLAVSTVTIVEIVRGLERMAAGQRRNDLSQRFETLVAPANRFAILPLHELAARQAGLFLSARESQGRPVSAVDMMIAGITATNGAALATRNTRDFSGLGLTLINPS